MITRLQILPATIVSGLFVLVLAGCERPPVEAVQRGYRGTGMVQVYNPRAVESQAERNTAPESLRQRDVPDAPKAKDLYQGVQVLGDLNIVEFGRTMAAMTQWIAPKDEACNYCHVEGNMADDSKYTKLVARRMIQMTQSVNANWSSHVQQTGVTCYTCHRGQPVPQYTWFQAPPQDLKSNFIGDKAEQNMPARSTTLATLPYDSFTYFLKEDYPIRVRGTEALPSEDPATRNRASIKQAEFTYALMVHMSDGLGVNCTYCHNSRAFASWAESPPQRVVAWYGIRMVRDINNTYLAGLDKTFPVNAPFPPARLGAVGDVAKVNCATCHQGAYKPLYGAPMAKDYPALRGAAQVVAADGAPKP